MKKIFALAGILALLLSASVALAEQNGLYVAPKFVYSYQRIDNTELKIDVEGLFSDSQDLDDEKDSAFGGALAFGYDFNPNFQVPVRVELEYAIRSESEGDYSSSFTEDSVLIRESGTFKFVVQSVFINAFYDFDTGTAFTPYIGGGLGIAIIDADGKLKVSEDGTGVYDESASNTETNFAFNLAAGVGYDVNEALTLDLGYRYADFGNAESGDVGFDDVEIKGKAHLKAHEVLFGLRYTF
jgi:outer membrane autotransporter protein